ncbi:hypothetical protein [Patiriisocius marinus]|nr:hypothetical protein [Patiriisocius marinus]
MKKTLQNNTPVMALVCSVLGHHYVVTATITQHIHEYKCTCCGKEVTDTDKGFLTELTSKQREINKILYSYVQRRSNRITNKLSA